MTATILVVGFSELSNWYNLFVFPVIFIAYTLLIIKTMPYFFRRHVKSDESIFGLSNVESSFYFRFETANGPLTITSHSRIYILTEVRVQVNQKAG